MDHQCIKEMIFGTQLRPDGAIFTIGQWGQFLRLQCHRTRELFPFAPPSSQVEFPEAAGGLHAKEAFALP